MAEEISKQPSIDSVVWLLVLTLMKIYNEKEQAEKIKVQNAEIKKRGTRKQNRAKSCVKEINSLRNRIKGVVTSTFRVKSKRNRLWNTSKTKKSC